ncbi:methylated-DNA--[protein]-cysteine S-methyltransferase [Nonlabens marinus]|uniref:methylated-DNA--[protein]-cysteine S-methyltransferase n=1 Tax=Nonlabens marinus S1-08 TaxID=1454201 RepID=W8VXT3_9FLAO|nr:methylated-DNA--[protein]-cysteine S-methyltransferase [Nonlabens marinus]BAO56477.1 methylated-DNA--protein-cysteine methyltransferase [Nonlabens marinus S1-08]
MSNIITASYTSPVGELLIGVYNNQLCLCDWVYRKQRPTIDNRVQKFCGAIYKEGTHDVITSTVQQLDAYFKGELKQFDVPLLCCGTDFQKSIWQDLQDIPYGETMSYASLSRKRNNPKSIRAVAAANGANAISILIPCHRIIGSDGSLTGYAGGLRAKEALLQLEGIDLYNGQQSLF